MNSGPHILVIDDEPQILRALRTILTEKDFSVTTASRGEEGLALAAATPPDLIILDLGLPDMDGIDVCARLREWIECPIIVLSVRDSEREKVAAFDKGADDYLTKPFGIGELLARCPGGAAAFISYERHADKRGPSRVFEDRPRMACGYARRRRSQADCNRV